MSSKPMPNPRLLHHRIRRMPRLDLAVDGHIAVGDRAEPDVVVALAVADERAAVLGQDAASTSRSSVGCKCVSAYCTATRTDREGMPWSGAIRAKGALAPYGVSPPQSASTSLARAQSRIPARRHRRRSRVSLPKCGPVCARARTRTNRSGSTRGWRVRAR